MRLDRVSACGSDEADRLEDCQRGEGGRVRMEWRDSMIVKEEG